MKNGYRITIAITIISVILSIAMFITAVKTSSHLAYAIEAINAEEEVAIIESQEITPLSASSRSNDLVVINGINSSTEEELRLSINSFTDVHHIPNANYFIINPLHKSNYKGESKAGLCTTVALQLLMGYHNYYSDGRIIPSSISSSSGDTSRLLETDYRNSENDPVFKRDIVEGQGCSCIGTTDAFFEALNGYNTLSNSALFGQMISVVKESGVSFMEHNTPIAVRDKISLTSGVFSKAEAQSDIDEGRPIVLGMHPLNDELSFHVVVAYGYAKLDNVDGFLVHYGWGEQRTRVWVPASWFAFKIRMTADTHVHSYSVSGNVVGTHKELTCTICGVKKVESLYGFSGGTINSVKYVLPEEIDIPKTIDVYNPTLAQFTSQEITAIEQEVFKNHTEINSVTIPKSIQTIGNYAFRNCTSLSSVTIPSNSSLNSVGQGAFSGCSALYNMSVFPLGVSKIKAETFDGCSSLVSIGLQTSMAEIGDYAFRNCTSLSFALVVLCENLNRIGNGAFLGCTALNSISLPSGVTEIGFEAFESNTVLTSFTGNRADINLVIVSGEKDTYVENGWDGFNIVEMSGSGALEITSGELKGDVAIPYTFNNRVVTSIDSNGFANQTELTSISFTSVTAIYGKAFANCPELESVSYVSMPNLTNIANHTTSYENYYYTETCLNTTLIAGCTYKLSFDYSDLTATTDVSNVFTSLGVGGNTFAVDLPVQKTFSNTSGTQTIVFTPTESQISTSNKLWCRFIRTSTPQSVSVTIKNVKITCGVESITRTAFDNCPKLATGGLVYTLLSDDTYAISGISMNMGQALTYAFSRTYFIPSEYNGKTVSRIEAGVFRDTAETDDFKAQWIFLQEGVATIGDNAFRDQTKITEITIPASVTSIGNNSFQNCNKLNTLSYGDDSHLLTIGSYAFADCSKLYVNIPISLTTIGAYAFQNCTSTLTINYVGESALTTIGQYAFSGCTNMFIVTFPASIKTIGSYAFTDCPNFYKIYFEDGVSDLSIGSYAFSGCEKLVTVSLPSDVIYIGNNAFNSCIALETVLLSSNVNTIGNNAFANCSLLTIYTEKSSKPSGWQSNWNSSGRPVVWNCTFSTEPLYVVSFVKSASNPSNTTAENGIKSPSRKDYTFRGWYTTSDFSGTAYTDMTTAPNGTLYAKWTEREASCVAEGTLITLADGTQKAVEELTGDEQLLVWNMLTGAFDVAPILFIDSDPVSTYQIIELSFSDGTQVKVIDEHAFWDLDLNKYVFLREDAGQYIGHWFNKQTTDEEGNLISVRVRLESVNIYAETTSAWSPVTYGHLCLYVNGMLSMPGATEAFINIFDVDPETMKYDTAQMEADIATYGLYTYEEFNALIPVPEAVFNAFNGQYLKVAIGKGYTSLDEIGCLIERYSVFF